eukprot:358896-Amphidinium_carterae.2
MPSISKKSQMRYRGTAHVRSKKTYFTAVFNQVSETFGKFIRMEFEKVYCPFLMMGKKRYAGLSWVDPDQSGKLDVKGETCNVSPAHGQLSPFLFS